MIRINVNGVSATVTAKEILTAGRVGLECEFTFDGEWDGLFKTAVFQGIETIEVALPNAVCTVPYEALAVEGVQLKIGVYGANGAGTIVIPTVWVNAGKILPSAGAVPPDTPTQTANAYAVEKAEQAYNIALGVQQKAENGDFDGAPGAPGADGFSPTATVSKVGNTATITITDENGTTSAVIHDGTDGEDGADGSKIWNTTVEPLESMTGTFTFQVSDLSGASGTPAVGDLVFYDSAYYPIAGVIGNINVGLEAIANYKVDIRGETGEIGPQGPQGEQGPAGASVSPYTSTPAALGTASAGSSNDYARGDHVHQMPTAAQVGAYVKPSGGIPKSDLAAALSSEITQNTDDVADLKSAFVTPEMYGAKGDGATDDSSAIQKAIDSGNPVIMSKNYRINNTLNITNAETVIVCPGTIIIDSDIVVFDIKSSSNIINIKKIKGPDGSFSDGLWHFAGTAFKLNADGARVSCNELTVHTADRIKKVFDFYANGTFGTATNKCYFDYLFCEYGVYYSCGNSGLPWHNENQFFGSRVRGNYGVYTVKGETQADPYNGNKFINFSFEGIVCAVKAEFFQYNHFENCRMAESLNGTYWIDLAADCHSNVFRISTAIFKSQINDLNNSIYPNVYNAQVFTATVNGSAASFGLGGNVYKQAAGWTAEKVFAARRNFDLVGDGVSHDMPDIGLLDGWLVNVTRDNGAAYLNIPNGYGYGYGNGAEVIKLRVSSGNNLFIARQNGSNINKSQIPAADSGYYELRYMPNYEWVLTKISDL